MRLFVASIFLLLPIATFAAPPADVSGIEFIKDNQGITVSWQPLQEDQNVAYYRVYFSHKSILQNGGDWDDYQRTEGPEALYLFTESPIATDPVFVSVLAVSKSGDESEYFAEEVTISFVNDDDSALPIDDPEDQETSQNDDPEDQNKEDAMPKESAEETASESTTEDNSESTEETEKEADYVPDVLELISAEATSAKTVSVQFSQDAVLSDEADTYVTIEDPNGNRLAVQSLQSDGSALLLTTDKQTAGTVYKITVLQGVLDADLQVLADDQSSLLFVGHKDGNKIPTTPPKTGLTEVTNLKAKPQKQGAYYSLQISWDYPSDRDEVSHFSVLQSRDGGKTYGTPQNVKSDAAGVYLELVQPGTVTLVIQVVGKNGSATKGITKTVQMGSAVSPKPMQTLPATTVPVYTPKPMYPPITSHLPQSGGMIAMFSMALGGAFMGLKKARKRNS